MPSPKTSQPSPQGLRLSRAPPALPSGHTAGHPGRGHSCRGTESEAYTRPHRRSPSLKSHARHELQRNPSISSNRPEHICSFLLRAQDVSRASAPQGLKIPLGSTGKPSLGGCQPEAGYACRLFLRAGGRDALPGPLPDLLSLPSPRPMLPPGEWTAGSSGPTHFS